MKVTRKIVHLLGGHQKKWNPVVGKIGNREYMDQAENNEMKRLSLRGGCNLNSTFFTI